MAKAADVIVIGAGHNGLVCASYLAKSGLDVLVVERSHRIGGACITEELVPGYQFSTFAYSAHGRAPRICRDLEIPPDAWLIEEADPRMFTPFPDGDHLFLWQDVNRTVTGLERLSQRDAQVYPDYLQYMDKAVQMTKDWYFEPPQNHQALYERYRGTEYVDVLEAMLTRSHWDVLGDFFESEKIKTVLARADDVGSPAAVGSFLAEAVEAANCASGVEGKSGLPRGGMGVITVALAEALVRWGGQIQTKTAVQKILLENGRAVGVQVDSGQVLRADLIVSNADPKRTFLTLLASEDVPGSFRRQVSNLKTRAGYMKYHAILSDFSRFSAMPSEHADDPRCAASVRIAPSLEYFESAWHDAQQGRPSKQPVMSLQLPTAYGSQECQLGKHIFGAWVRYGPARLKSGTWDHIRGKVMQNIVGQIEQYAPGFTDAIEWQRLYTVADVERETGITDASIRHVDMTLDQMLHRRPLPAWSAYKSPIASLWMCGSGPTLVDR
ncbi:MAG: hypothetical protein CMJ20_04070 [Phycisphaeraceae bacterium]|nr:hypothetical protein [Phycisphaeraceae bacterium]